MPTSVRDSGYEVAGISVKVFITGAHGQVGLALQRQASMRGWQMMAVDRDDLDITDANAISAAVGRYSPDAVINAAAYTAVDGAEARSDISYAVNRDGPANLAAACARLDIPLVHYSTDYVFDGTKEDAYAEDDPVAPLGVYGASKLAGEQAVHSACTKYLILRTSWVFSAHGHNFVKTMLRLGKEHGQLQVVADQYGKPTSAAELARLTGEILEKAEGRWGIYHAAQPPVTSWHGFAEAIFAEAHRQGIELKVTEVLALTTAEYPTPARRPANSALNCEHLEASFGLIIRPWQESLAEVIGELKHA